jgi:ubiquinone/menaquinone biosynthesis C-methylase UbiE
VFVTRYLNGNGIGIDFYPREGLSKESIIKDCTHLPFNDASFNSVTFIANFYHIPKSKRDAELSEAYRCLKHGGNIIITMGNPIAEIIVYRLVGVYDRFLGTNIDIPREEYFTRDSEIIERLLRTGFVNISKKYFLTQWCLKHLLIGWKK